jgi:hypothetical protein
MSPVARTLGFFSLLFSATVLFVVLSPGNNPGKFSILLQGNDDHGLPSSGGPAKPMGIPSSWLSTKDLAVSPLLHINREPARVFGGGLAQSPTGSNVAEHPPANVQPPTPRVSAENVGSEVQQQKFTSIPSQKLVETPRKVQDLQKEGITVSSVVNLPCVYVCCVCFCVCVTFVRARPASTFV